VVFYYFLSAKKRAQCNAMQSIARVIGFVFVGFIPLFSTLVVFCIAHALLVMFDVFCSCDRASRDDCQCCLLLTLIFSKF